MRWFKFYGQDFLTDPKMKMLSLEEKMCWVVLLCMANAEDKAGQVHYVSECDVMEHAGIEPESPMWAGTVGLFGKFESMQMVHIDNVINDNVRGVSRRYNLTLSHFQVRQQSSLSAYERVKRHRQQSKKPNNSNNLKANDNVTNVINDNVEIRIDKKREEKKNTPLPPLPSDLSKIPDLQTSWDEWVEHRRGIKKPLTVLAAEKTFKFLRGQADPVALIDTAIRNGWRGLFKEKENGQGQNRQSPPVNSQLARAQYKHGEKDIERYRQSEQNLRAIREDFENNGGATKE